MATLSASPSSAPMSLRTSARRCSKVRKPPHKGSKPARLRRERGSRASGFLEEDMAHRRKRQHNGQPNENKNEENTRMRKNKEF